MIEVSSLEELSEIYSILVPVRGAFISNFNFLCCIALCTYAALLTFTLTLRLDDCETIVIRLFESVTTD